MIPGCRISIKVENFTILVGLYSGGGRVLVVNDYCKLAEKKPAPLFADIIYINDSGMQRLEKFFKLRLSEREKPPVTKIRIRSRMETSGLHVGQFFGLPTGYVPAALQQVEGLGPGLK
jgi:hypothetical protein